jgi:4-aminobutyrate aminotransferase-like enzyme
VSDMTLGARARSAAVCDRIRVLEGSGMRTFSDPEPVVWARTEGSWVEDEDGRRYLDLYGGFAVASVGYCHPRVTEAIVRQAGTMTHCPSAAPSAVRAGLYERLTAIAPRGLDRVLPAITGAMANEWAIQLARVATGRETVLTFGGTYLGRTVGTVGHAGKRAYRDRLGVSADAHFLPYPDPFRSPWAGTDDPVAAVLALAEALLEDPASGVGAPACIVVEPVPGNGGVVFPPDGFLTGLRRLADRSGALLIFDEIQCGVGRTGRMWASQHEDVVPDMLTIGKGIGGGLPIAAILGTETALSTFEPDAITSTFLANALPAVAACATIDVVLEDGLVARSDELGRVLLDRLTTGLAGAPHVGEVRGRGLFAGIELVGADGREPDAARAVAAQTAARDRGLLLGLSGRHGNVLKLSPALNVDEADLDAGLTTTLEVLA